MQYDPEDWENYHKGIRYFNRGKFFEAHEAWEEIWKRTTDEEDKTFLQGLIQAAAFLLHLKKDEGTPPAELYEKSSQKLEVFRRGYWGVDIHQFLETFKATQEKIIRQEKVETFPKITFLKKEEDPKTQTPNPIPREGFTDEAS